MSERLLFLDLDGVCNCHEPTPESLCGRIHPDKMELLNGILRATGAKVVLSSAWRYLLHRGEMNLTGMEWLLRSHGMIAGRLLGITRSDYETPRKPYSGNPADWQHTNERGKQVSEWLHRYGRNYRHVVIDDLDLGITDAGHPFVHVDGSVGLTWEDAMWAVRLLTEE